MRRCVGSGKRWCGSLGPARQERWMTWAVVAAIRGAMTRTAVTVALIGVAAAGATVPTNATPRVADMPGIPVPLRGPNPGSPPTNPDDPRCAADPEAGQCHGAGNAPDPTWPYPDNPNDPRCGVFPDLAQCQGSPYTAAPLPPAAPPSAVDPSPLAPPPPMDGGMPGGIGDMPGGAGDMPGGAGDMPGGAGDMPGGAGDMPGGAGDMSGGAGDMSGGLGSMAAPIG